jgi:hypothetical protein
MFLSTAFLCFFLLSFYASLYFISMFPLMYLSIFISSLTRKLDLSILPSVNRNFNSGPNSAGLRPYKFVRGALGRETEQQAATVDSCSCSCHGQSEFVQMSEPEPFHFSCQCSVVGTFSFWALEGTVSTARPNNCCIHLVRFTVAYRLFLKQPPLIHCFFCRRRLAPQPHFFGLS